MRPHPRSIAPTLARLIAPALAAGLLAGCTVAGTTAAPPDVSTPVASTPTPAASTSAAPSSQPAKYAVSSDPDALVLRIDTTGGLIAPGVVLTHIPAFSLYADGRIVTIGAVDAIYPGPLLPNLIESKLTADDVQKLLAAADHAGLLGPDAAYDVGGVADAGTTTFTTTVAGKTHRVSAYALGIGGDPGAEPDVVQARAKLDAFESKAFDLGSFLGHAVNHTIYRPTAARLYVGEPAQVQPPMTQQELAWPLGVDPATGEPTLNPGSKCLAIGGADFTTFLAVARTANELTVWKAPSGRYSLQVRPLLPGESGCA